MDYCKIGNVVIAKKAVLAPMASVADKAYRLINKKYGAAFAVSEMISAKGLCYNSSKTEELCEITDAERPMALQLFGSEPEYIHKAVKILLKYSPDIIDLNMGCPVPKVVNTGAGCALMKDAALASEILSAAIDAADGVPVTVKFRKGWDENSVNAVEFACEMEKTGAAAVAIHARTRNQFYSGNADWDAIKAVKQAVGIPVIGNGDVFSLSDCLDMYSQTNCDLVMIGRGSYGNPFIFREIDAYFEGKDYTPPEITEIMEAMLEHIGLILQFKGDRIGIREARKHAAWYIKDLYGAAHFRQRCYSLSTYEDAKIIAKDFIKLQEERLK